ncbi:hypothetical protein CDV31_014332 [Fusarium ambrosium]|uniref:Uncharacterized protein n=1 Tax=Fusarium ambrosium TaxID=131363 RepID=A0A428SXE3_9HYPO|nr:hypothetical protein CDV31_014332 [Fusarium ambrosium]
MEVALTFGSLGDIIAICQVAVQLGRAIGIGSRVVGESAKEYQDFREDLDAFVRILMQVVATYQQHEFSPYLDGLDNATKSVINQKSARVDNATLCARIEEIRQLVSDNCQSREEMLDLLGVQNTASENQAEKLEDMSQQLVVQEKSNRDILGLAKDTFSGILEVKALLVQISQTVVNLQVMASNSMFLRPLDPTKELPVILEDALGNELPIPSQWLDSLEWEVFYGLLTGHFKGRNGYDMVLKREYALEESSSGRDLDRNRPLHFCLRKGMKINMSMIFDAGAVVSGACPRCNMVTNVPEDVTVQCTRSSCGMWFRTQKIVIEALEAPHFSQGTDPGSTTGKRSAIVTSLPAEPADFQRVRLVRQERSGLQIDMSEYEGSEESVLEDVSVEKSGEVEWIEASTRGSSGQTIGETYNLDMEERKETGKNKRRHRPARAFQFGNTTIIEDLHGEVDNVEFSKSSVSGSEGEPENIPSGRPSPQSGSESVSPTRRGDPSSSGGSSEEQGETHLERKRRLAALEDLN